MSQVLQKKCDSEIVSFFTNRYKTSDIGTIFLKAAREYIKNIPVSKGKGKCGSVEEGVAVYLKFYRTYFQIPFYLKTLYQDLLLEGKKQKEEKIYIVAA